MSKSKKPAEGWESLRDQMKGLRQPILAQWNVKCGDSRESWGKVSLRKDEMKAIIERQTKESQILRERKRAKDAEKVKANCTAHAFWHDCKSFEGQPGDSTWSVALVGRSGAGARLGVVFIIVVVVLFIVAVVVAV